MIRKKYFEMVCKFNWLLLYMRISTFSFWSLPVCKRPSLYSTTNQNKRWEGQGMRLQLWQQLEVPRPPPTCNFDACIRSYYDT